MSDDFDIKGAVEIAASANNSIQTSIFYTKRHAAVGKKKRATARHIIGRFLELAPSDLTVSELLELLDEEMPILFTDVE